MTAKVSGASKMKITTGGFKKAIALVVIAAFALQMHIPLHPQVEAEIVKQFQRAKTWYLNGKYDDARMRIERVIDIINEKNTYRKDILGMCYLLLGAIAEKQNKPLPAQENYLKARGVYGITLVDGVDLEGLSLYKIMVKGEPPPSSSSRDGKIEKEGAKKKKKFPWLLAVGAVVVVGALVYFLLLKPRKKFTLTVVRGEGVLGDPQGNTYRYKKGAMVAYNYTPAPGYSGLAVTLDGNAALDSGAVKMDKDHILAASSSLNVVTMVTDRKIVEIPEGKSIAFNVKLSAQPQSNVNVTVSRAGGDQDIQVVNGGVLFNTSNWATYQPVILQAGEDEDVVDGEATIRLSADGAPNVYITAQEKDNDHPTVSIVEPGDRDTVKGEVTITAEASTAEKIINRVEFYIDGKKEAIDIAAPYSYTWDTAAVSDGQHKIKAIAYDSGNYTGNHEILVNVKNRYTLSVTKGNGVDGAPDTGSASYVDGETVTYNYILLTGYNNLVVLVDGAEAAASGSITMDRDHELSALADPALYSLTVEMGDGVLGFPDGTRRYTEGKSVSYFYRLQEGYFDLLVKLDGNQVENPGTVTMDGNHTLVVEAKVGFETDTDEVVICEGKTKRFGVKLSAQPENPVTASVRWIHGDTDIGVDSGASLTFTRSDWDVFQYVTLHAAEDTDTDVGQAAIVVEAPGLTSWTIVAKEHDTTQDPRPEISISGVSDGQMIYGAVVIVAEVNDDDGAPNRVEFYIDGELKETKETGTGASYKYEWNTAGVALGEHKIKIIAYDMCDQPGEKEITVIVGNSPSAAN